MDFEKLPRLGEYLTEWLRITLLTLRNPVMRFELVATSAAPSPVIVQGSNVKSNVWLDPKLISYALLSISIGVVMNNLLPDRIPGPGLVKELVIMLILWVAYGSLLFVVCSYLLKGKASYLETLSVSIQVLATIYVATSFISLIGAILLSDHTTAAIRIPFIGWSSISKSVLFFFILWAFLSAIYVSLSMKAIHRFGWFRTLLLAVLPIIAIIWIFIPIYLDMGMVMGRFRFS
jgi:hypothetical protein